MAKKKTLTNQDWVEMHDGDRIACCDCGLIHKLKFRVEFDSSIPNAEEAIMSSKLLMNAKRMVKETKEYRKEYFEA